MRCHPQALVQQRKMLQSRISWWFSIHSEIGSSLGVLVFRPRQVGGHHSEGFLWRADIDRLPVPVQDQNDGLVQNAAHIVLGVCSLWKWLPRRDSHPDLRFQRPAHYCLCHEARRRASRYGAAGNGLPSRSSQSEGWSIRTIIRAFKGRCPTVRRPGKGLCRAAPDSHRVRDGLQPSASTERGLSPLPLPWATGAHRRWCRVKDSHPQPSRSERDASAGWANAA
jgi:hypothetical protein